VISGPNEIPEIKALAPKPAAAPVRRIPTEPTAKPRPEADRKLVQAPDSVQLSPKAQSASRISNIVERTPEVRPERVQEASAQVRSSSQDNASANAKLAEKLLTEN
jgi:hypothetical protein